MTKQLQVLLNRALHQGSPDLLPVCFRVEVLDAYRGRPGFSLIRSDSAGRLKQDGGWSIDFGISPGDELIHLTWRDLLSRLPESERASWLEFTESPPLSTNFLQMQMAPGSCLDDGEIRPW